MMVKKCHDDEKLLTDHQEEVRSAVERAEGKWKNRKSELHHPKKRSLKRVKKSKEMKFSQKRNGRQLVGEVSVLQEKAPRSDRKASEEVDLKVVN